MIFFVIHWRWKIVHEEVHINLKNIINKIIVDNSNSHQHYQNKLIILTNFDLVPIYLFNKLEKKLFRYIDENLCSYLSNPNKKNAFYLAKQNHTLITYDHEALIDYNIMSVARPVIIEDRLIGFLGFFQIVKLMKTICFHWILPQSIL